MIQRTLRAFALVFVAALALTVFVATGSASNVQPKPLLSHSFPASVHPDPWLSHGSPTNVPDQDVRAHAPKVDVRAHAPKIDVYLRSTRALS